MQMVDDRVDAGRRALGSVLWGAVSCCSAVWLYFVRCTTPWCKLYSSMEPKLGVALDAWSLWNRSS